MTVTSEWLVKGADGSECKPEDYLTAFARFVRENPAHIEAIRILLHRPKDWGTDALSELRAEARCKPGAFRYREPSEGSRDPLSKGAGGHHFHDQARRQG